MKKLYISLFWKFLIAIILTVTLFGLLNINFVWRKVYNLIDIEISKRIIYIGKNLANQSLRYILYKDISSLQSILDETKKSDPIIEYCFITDSENNVLAHTFTQGFPKKLLKVNKLRQGDTLSIIKIYAENYQTKNINDVIIPVLDGKVGYVRLGINDDIAWLNLKSTFITFIVIFLSFTLLGFLGAFIFSYLIAEPIKRIKMTAEKIDIENLKNIGEISNIKSTHDLIFANFSIRDEIDDLSEKFNEMILRLNTTYQKLIATQSAMNQSEKLASIGTLVSGIAHEINNPLSGLQSCIRRIGEHPDNIAQNVKYIEIMNETTAKIQNIVKGLLDFSRVSSGKKEYNNINQIIENTIKLMKFRKSFSVIDIVFRTEKDEQILKCNKNEMEQVFFNLIKNSIEAIEEKLKIDDNHKGKIEITLTTSNSTVEIDIYDNGIGIKKENITKVFDPFFTTKDVGKGTGLGCSICYNIIRDHNGEFIIESDYLKWTLQKIIFQR